MLSLRFKYIKTKEIKLRQNWEFDLDEKFHKIERLNVSILK